MTNEEDFGKCLQEGIVELGRALGITVNTPDQLNKNDCQSLNKNQSDESCDSKDDTPKLDIYKMIDETINLLGKVVDEQKAKKTSYIQVPLDSFLGITDAIGLDREEVLDRLASNYERENRGKGL